MEDRDERFAMYFPNESENPSAGGVPRRQEQVGDDSIARISDTSLSESGPKAAPTPFLGESSAEEKGCSAPTLTSKLQYRLWRVLFSNINRSVEEFYRLAEEESNEEKCHEMLALLATTTRDFSKLLERLEGFRALEPHTAGVSWEVRKPVRSLGVRSSATSPQSKVQNQPKQSAEGSTPEVSSVPSATSKRLSATAIPFQPSHMVFSVPVAVNGVGASNASPASGTSHPVHPTLETGTLNTTAGPTYAATSADKDSFHATGGGLYIETPDISESQTSTPSHSPNSGSATANTATNSRKTSYVTRSARTIHSAGEFGGKSVDLVQSCREQTTAVTPVSPTRIEEWDADTEAQVVLASERVWAEAEAWVEAEAQAEEEAWQLLHSNREKNDFRGNGESWYADPVAGEFSSVERFGSGRYNLNSPMISRDDECNASADVRCRLLASPDLQKPEDSAFESSTHTFLSTVFPSAKHLPATPITTSQVDVPCSASVIDPSPTVLSKSIMNDNPDAVEDPFPQIVFSPHDFLVSANRYFANDNHDQDSVCGPYTSCTQCSVTAGSSVLRLSTPSTGTSGHSTPHTGGSGSRSLHEKLSSPDRRKTLSPSEAKRKHEARQIAAESNRDRSVNERIQKAMIASERVRLRGEKEAQRLAQAEQALEDRLKDAEKRHFEHIKTIRGKAGNENAKVSEVMFINNLNGEGIAAELQRRLEEAEARILAAGLRRQERITSILEKGQRKSSHKSKQMSALRLQLETKKMERWSKLQSRLEAVQRRRNARLEEMKRRSEEEEQEAVRIALESAAVPGAPREDAKLATAATISRRPCGESSKVKEKKRKSKARKATELQLKQDEEIFAEFSGFNESAASKSISPSARAEYSGAEMPLEWVGPGGAEDPQQIDMSGVYMTVHAIQAKRVVQLARICAFGSEPDTKSKTDATVEQLLMPVDSSGACWGSSGNARLTSSWPESGSSLLRIMQSASLGIVDKAKLNNEARLMLISLGFVAKEEPLLQQVGHSEKSAGGELDDSDPETINTRTVITKKLRKKKKKKQESLDGFSVILQPDCEYGRLATCTHADDTSAWSPRIILTPAAINGMGKAFSEALYSAKFVAAVNDAQSAAAASYANLGGALLLRTFFGTELGCLSSPSRAAEFVPTEAFLAASKVFSLISCSSGEARDVLLVFGTGVALADVVHMLLLQLENWWRRARHQRDKYTGGSRDVDFVDSSSSPTCSSVLGYCAAGEEAVGLTGSLTDRKPTKCYSFPQVNSRKPVQPWIAVQASALPHLLRALDALVRHVPTSNTSDLISAKDRQDALLWYIFSSGLPSVLGSTLQVLRALGSAATSFSFLRALTCHVPELLAGLASFLR